MYIAYTRGSFFVQLKAYAYEEFCQITIRLLTSNHPSADEEIAKAVEAVWKTLRNIRDSIKIARMAKSVEGFCVDLINRLEVILSQK
jgi:hypothetical protein